MAVHHAETAGNWVRSHPKSDCKPNRRSNHGHIRKSPMPGVSPVHNKKKKKKHTLLSKQLQLQTEVVGKVVKMNCIMLNYIDVRISADNNAFKKV